MSAHSDQDNPHSYSQTGTQQTTTPPFEQLPGSSLGLLDDASAGSQATDSHDVAILRRLKLAILEGQHPYFKANVDLSNLQDLVLATSSSHITSPASRLDLPEGTVLAEQINPSLQDNGPPTSITSIASAVNGRDSSEGAAESAVDKRSHDIEMKNGEPDQTRIASKDSGEGVSGESPCDPIISKTSGSAYTLGRYTLLSPIEPEATNHIGRGRSASDASTVIDMAQQTTESIIDIKRESPPHQLAGSQVLSKDPTSSSLSSFASIVTTSTVPTSESGADADTSGKTGDGVDLSGYDPKYGNKADYLRHQKARVKMIGSIEEKTRRPGSRLEERPEPKSPPRQTQSLSRRGTGSQDLLVREPEYVPRTNTLPPPSRTPSMHVREASPSGPRRGPTVDTAKDRLPPPPSRRQSPRRSQATSFSRPASPPLGRYLPPQRPRDYSPPRDIRPQYLPYDDPVPAPTRPRPVVSSPPRGSPPRETSASRAADRQAMDDYPGLLRRNEARSFDLRPASSSTVFADRPSSRNSGAFDLDRDGTWALSSRGLPRAPVSRASPPRHETARERTSFSSSSLPANPNAGYRPQSVPDLTSPTRYTAPYDPTGRRPDASWPSRDWDATRAPEPKPKLQDRFTMEPGWSHDRDRDRDEFGARAREREGFRREPSPAYSEGLRSGFRRPSDIESGMRPMKRSRPDETYLSRGAPGPERSRFELDGRPPAGEYYPREPVRRLDDEYIPRTRPPYGYSGPP
ncbi:hypothetical protein FRC08_005675 [Ceratobasidium sp. 394]|nr:hypothetical protein FRC08_005675 [Ceratobasidium sp. 394]